MAQVDVPSEHLNSVALSVHPGAPASAACLLRALLLTRVQDGSGLLGLVSRLLSTIASGGVSGAVGRMGGESRSALLDAMWLIDHDPPRWWKPLPVHHATFVESTKLWFAAPLRPCANQKEASVRAALARLHCQVASDVVGHLVVPLTVSDWKLALECPQAADLRFLDSSPPILRPLVKLRFEQLRHAGWSVETVLDHEWPSDGTEDCAHRQALFLRLKLMEVLQRRVPRSRRVRALRTETHAKESAPK